MSSMEVLVIVVFGYLGYLVVSFLISPKPKTDGSQANSRDNEASSRDSQSYPAGDVDDMNANWFRILDVPQTANQEIITSAYKRKISQYHPDKVASLGLELKELAELKSKQINAAYNYATQLKK